MKKFAAWISALACASLLSACGGGGGSPGAINNPPPPVVVSKVKSVSLVASAATIDSSGKAGTEVTLTAVVKDEGSNALMGETVSFTASSGVISNTVRNTDANGQVIEKLSVKDSAAPRDITITANVGAVVSAPVKVTVVVATPTLTLSADSGVLPSSGAAGSEVTLTTVVKDAANNVVPGVLVRLSADSGNLAYSNATTDAKGAVTAKLDTGANPTTRTIVVTASSDGAKSVTLPVSVQGNKLVINNSSTIKVGAVTDVTVKLVDSAGNALSGKPVTFSAAINSIAVKGGGAAVTNSAGQLVLSYTASGPGSDMITVKSVGETTASTIAVSAANFTVGAAAGDSVSINTCQPILVHYDVAGQAQPGSVAVSISRGKMYSDPGCLAQLSTPLTLSNGNAVGYAQAVSPGVAGLTATAVGLSTQGAVEFVAPYTASAVVSVQADPAVLGVNTAGSTAQQSTLRAIVLDGTPANNLVKNAQVAFTVVNDPSGGYLSQPSVVTTGADGTASVSYIAGTSDTKLDGVMIQAQLQGASNAVGNVKLTVAKRALFITAGTGNTLATPNSSTYQLDYTVFVTDAAGNPVSGVNLTSSVRPRNYYKGQLYFVGVAGPWQVGSAVNGFPAPVGCANEDVNSDGLLQPGEDINGDGVLTPGNAITVTPTAVTDAKGQATVSLNYARDHANWLDFDLTIRGQVSGSEARYVAYSVLPGLAADFAALGTTPPGKISPYGITGTCAN